MDSLTGILSANHLYKALPLCQGRLASTSMSGVDGRLPRCRTRLSGPQSLRSVQTRRFLNPASSPIRRWSVRSVSWNGIDLRASSENRKSKGVGKSKGVPGKSEKRQAKDNVWSSSRQTKGIPEVKKQGKKQKHNVWSSSQHEESEGGQTKFVSPRARNVGFEKGDEQGRVASSWREDQMQQRKDEGDISFLRFLSPVLPLEEETSLQAEEPIPNPLWTTFCSSNSGVWRGVMAAFSPNTGEFEPLSINENQQYIFDARVLSTVTTLRTADDGTLLAADKQMLTRKVSWSLEDRVGDDGEGTVLFQEDDEEDNELEDDEADIDARDGDLSDDPFVMQGEIYDEVDQMKDWEDEVDTTDSDEVVSEREYVLGDPKEIDESWDNEGTEEIEIMDELDKDPDSVAEDGLAWRALWGSTEVLNGDLEDGDLVPTESQSDLMTQQSTSYSLGQSSTPSSLVGDASEPDETDFQGKTTMEVIEEDCMDWEPGLVFFEDGAFSRGPLELLTDVSASSRGVFDAYTTKIEQCLVAGGHKRLRIVHTISVEEEAERVELLRTTVFEEEWMGPSHLKSISESGGHHLKVFTERARHTPQDVVGNWKVFEVEAMAIPPLKSKGKEKGAFVFSCKETSMKRGLPVIPKVAVKEESIDLSSFSMLWLTGSVSTYARMSESETLTFGVGWVCDNGTRLVMERVYGGDGQLAQVITRSEMKGGQFKR